MWSHTLFADFLMVSVCFFKRIWGFWVFVILGFCNPSFRCFDIVRSVCTDLKKGLLDLKKLVTNLFWVVLAMLLQVSSNQKIGTMETCSLTSSILLIFLHWLCQFLFIYNLGHLDPRMEMYRFLWLGENLHLTTVCGMEQWRKISTHWLWLHPGNIPRR
jgi:hypothetical protein